MIKYVTSTRYKKWKSLSEARQKIILYVSLNKTLYNKHLRPKSCQFLAEKTEKISVTLLPRTRMFLVLGSGWNIQRWWSVSHVKVPRTFFFKELIHEKSSMPCNYRVHIRILLLAGTGYFWTEQWSSRLFPSCMANCQFLIDLGLVSSMYKQSTCLKTEQVLSLISALDDSISPDCC